MTASAAVSPALQKCVSSGNPVVGVLLPPGAPSKQLTGTRKMPPRAKALNILFMSWLPSEVTQPSAR